MPKVEEFDLTQPDAVERLYRQSEARDRDSSGGGRWAASGPTARNPGRYFYANMAMGLHLIEGARVHGVKKFVQIGTICAYPKFTPVPFKEDEPVGRVSRGDQRPYGIAKKALLVMCQAYRQQYGLNAIYLLPVNLFGPRDNFDLNSSTLFRR